MALRIELEKDKYFCGAEYDRFKGNGGGYYFTVLVPRGEKLTYCNVEFTFPDIISTEEILKSELDNPIML